MMTKRLRVLNWAREAVRTMNRISTGMEGLIGPLEGSGSLQGVHKDLIMLRSDSRFIYEILPEVFEALRGLIESERASESAPCKNNCVICGEEEPPTPWPYVCRICEELQ